MSEDVKFENLEALQLTAPIAFQRIFVDWTGSINAALMLSQLAYWTRRTGWGRWVYKTAEEWEQELGLTLKEQQNARKKLKAANLILEKRDGLPCKLYFQINQPEFERRVYQRRKPNLSTGARQSSPVDRSTDKTTDKDYNTCPPGVPPVAGEIFLQKAAKCLATYLESAIKQKQNLRQHRKVLQWLLLKDLAGDKPRLKRILKLYTTAPHDKFMPRVYNAYDFRKKFAKIEAWVNKYEPPPPRERYEVEIIGTIRH